MGRNYVLNPTHDVHAAISGTLSTTGAQVVPAQYVGPGSGASLAWSIRKFDAWQTDVPGHPSKYLRLTWTGVASAGDPDYLPDFRYTFYEHWAFGCRELLGQSVSVNFWLRVLTGPLNVVPIVWINWRNGDYQIFDLPWTVLQSGAWTPAGGTITLPAIPVGKVMDETFYIGMGLDFVLAAGPTLDIASLSMVRAGETPDVRPVEMERAMCSSYY